MDVSEENGSENKNSAEFFRGMIRGKSQGSFSKVRRVIIFYTLGINQLAERGSTAQALHPSTRSSLSPPQSSAGGSTMADCSPNSHPMLQRLKNNFFSSKTSRLQSNPGHSQVSSPYAASPKHHPAFPHLAALCHP